MILCPFCDEDCKNKAGLNSHIFWKHHKKRLAVLISLSAILFFFLETIIPTVYQAEISYYFDKIITHKEPKLLISVNLIKEFGNNNSLIINNHNKNSLIQGMADFGIIPERSNLEPHQANIDDNLTKSTECLFFAYDKANTVKKDEIPPELKDVPGIEQYHTFTFSIPSREITDRLKLCQECVGYEIYGVNKGNRDIDFVNLEICVSKSQFIVEVSDNMVSYDNHCIRLKKEGIIRNESFLGRFIVKSNNKKVYFNLPENPISSLSGKFSSKGKDFEIRNDETTRIISGIIPNCKFKTNP